MSHCTKFAFTYTDERTIVKAFKKMNIACSTELVGEFKSDFSKNTLSKLGYLGNKQYRAICGRRGEYQLFVCRISENRYELLVEASGQSAINNTTAINGISNEFRRSYIRAAVDGVIARLDDAKMNSKVEEQNDAILIHFGPSLEYSLSVVFDDGMIHENVDGITGGFCAKLTEDIENILSHPDTELQTEWKTEYMKPIEDQNIQVLELTF